MLTLYDYGNSVCCQKVRITLVAKDQHWQAIPVDLFRLDQYDPNYLKLNPKGVVPTLVHDGKAIIESTLICEYLDDVFPDPPLVPKAPAERARMRIWPKFVDEGLFDGVADFSFSAMFRERMKSMTPEMREKRFRNIGDPRRRDRRVSTYELGVQSPYVRHSIAAYESAFRLLEQTLADGGPWIMGARPTLADIALMPFCARLDYLGLLGVWIDERPRVRDWWALATDWPSFQRGLRDLISQAEFAEMRTHGPKIRDDVAALLAGLRRDTATRPTA
jgi:glutathione S-transferase